MNIRIEAVIFDPRDPRAKALIGKEVYVGDSLVELFADEEKTTLSYIDASLFCPFGCKDCYNYTFIAPIPEPTPEPTYEAYKQWEEWMLNLVLCHKTDKARLLILGWTQLEIGNTLVATRTIKNSGVHSKISLKYLFEHCENLDGTPFGERVS